MLKLEVEIFGINGVVGADNEGSKGAKEEEADTNQAEHRHDELEGLGSEAQGASFLEGLCPVGDNLGHHDQQGGD